MPLTDYQRFRKLFNAIFDLLPTLPEDFDKRDLVRALARYRNLALPASVS